MTKRFTKYIPDSYNYTSVITIVDHETNKRSGSIDDFVDLLNELHEENQELKQQLREKQCRTKPITLNTHISDEDFKRIELLLKKYLGEHSIDEKLLDDLYFNQVGGI